MKELIALFSQHLQTALEAIAQVQLKPAERNIDNVLITGLGGSGIGGSIAAELFAPQANIPVLVNKDYHVPAFVNEGTLLIACSYSGNTEETLSAVNEALKSGVQVACISSGGKLKEMAEQHGWNCLSMEGGNPPRSMFGYSFAYLSYYFRHYGIIDSPVQDDIEKAIALLNKEEDSIRLEAEALADKLKNTVPHILAVAGSTGVAARWRQQLNENAKMLCWEAEIPEMNHNELVGWEGGSSRFSALFLRNKSDFERNQKRIEIIKEIIAGKTEHVYEVWSKGDSALQRALYLIHFGDWLSYYLSEINKVDIMDIKSIDLLKSELSKIPF